MMSIINEEDWKSVAEMIGVEIGVPFKVEIPTHFKQYMKRAMEDYDANIEDIEYCVYADGFACYDSCRSIFFGHDNNFLHAFVLGGILNHEIKERWKNVTPSTIRKVTNYMKNNELSLIDGGVLKQFEDEFANYTLED